MERRLETLGRVVIPRDCRNVLGWPTGVRVNMQLSGDKVIISRSECTCSLCGWSNEIKDVKGIRMCQSCIEEIKVGIFWDVN